MILHLKGLLSGISFGTTLALLSMTFSAPAIARDTKQEPLVAGNTAFAWAMYSQLAKQSGNLFFSPYSVSSAMGMVYCGARGATSTEMKGILDLPAEPENLGAAFRSLNRALAHNADKSHQKLNIANALCLTGGDISKDYKAGLQRDFDAEVFQGGLNAINSWVLQKTEGKIPTILEGLDPNSVCILLNAIYFKGTWETRFEKKGTHGGLFKVSPGDKVTVPFMCQTSEFRLLETKDFQAVSLPYTGNCLSMVILLPAEEAGLAKIEGQLSAQKLHETLDALKKAPLRKIQLSIPKLKLDSSYDLKPTFESLGMTLAFHGSADFRGMGWPTGGLWISQIQHKAFVEVNEDGTEAAAATAVEMATRAAVPVPPSFIANHPFLVLIQDDETGTILFLGRIENPRQVTHELPS